MACMERPTAEFWNDWQAATDASWRAYEAFVAQLKTLNDPSLVEAYADDGERDSMFLSSLWVAMARWRFMGATEWKGDKGKLVLPPGNATQ